MPKIYRWILSVGAICLFVAVIGGFITYLGHVSYGRIMVVVGVGLGNLMIVSFLFIKLFGKYFKCIKTDREKRI
jgi:hypothetical protein